MSDTYKLVNDDNMTLAVYPCGVEAGNYLVPKSDIFYDDKNKEQNIYLKKGQRCLILTGNPEEPDVVWFRICATGEVATWDETILESFEKALPKAELQAKDLLGKNLLIGITRYDCEGCIESTEGYFGKIIRIADETLYIYEDELQSEYTIPFDSNALEESDPEAVFTSNGRSVSGADYISQWKVASSPDEL